MISAKRELLKAYDENIIAHENDLIAAKYSGHTFDMVLNHCD